MPLIDHRVLVNASPEIIWQVLGDLAAFSKWYVGCTQTSILTTQRYGPGTRRRNMMEKGPDIVEEILSWYDNLGYEYTIVDGAPFRSSRGLVRLQAIPEGTIVQWTLEYEPKGIFSGARNALGIERRLNQEIEDSLKRLKRLVESSGTRMDTATREKVAMRPAPTVTERAALSEKVVQREKETRAETVERMPPIPPENSTPPITVISDDDLPAEEAPPAAIEEPPVEEDDTRPHQPVIIDQEQEAASDIAVEQAEAITSSDGPVESVPVISADGLATVEPPLDDEDTRPNIPLAEEADDLIPAQDHDMASGETAAATKPQPLTETAPDQGETADEDDHTVDEVPATPIIEEPPTAEEDTTPREVIFDDAVPVPSDEAATASERYEDTRQPQVAADLAAESPSGQEEDSTQPVEESPASMEDEPTADHVPAPIERQPSFFEQDIEPIGPSIWEVFGLKPPDEEDTDEDNSGSHNT